VEERYSYAIGESGLYAIRVGEWNFDAGAYTITLTIDPAPALLEPLLPAIPFNYSVITLPVHLGAIPNNIPANNPITDEVTTLGRVLFYDPRLSANNQTACASCHHQEQGFSDDTAGSTGFTGLTTRRTSMALANLRYFQPDQFFWDTRADSLEQLILMPIQDHLEMGSTLEGVVAELSATSFYAPLFADAFGTPEVTAERIALAISQFLRAMVSYESKYDTGLPIGFSNFTSQEEMGRQLFESHLVRCLFCHTTETQILLDPRNNGLDLVYVDNGLGEITGNSFDNGLFKPPSLRNIALTGPYMHDGRFQTLAEVIEHYSTGIRPHANLDAFLPPGGFNFSPTQKAALVAFLHTLTDNPFITDEKFSDPFVPPPLNE
jgi:cytochrome c peroxidase